MPIGCPHQINHITLPVRTIGIALDTDQDYRDGFDSEWTTYSLETSEDDDDDGSAISVSEVKKRWREACANYS